jgi:hypothetical protein
MFFNITNPQGPTEVYKYINTAAKDGFKPANGFEVLNRTNNYAVIKKMLNEIKKLPTDAQKEFKDVVVASIEGRTTSVDSRFLMTELAVAGDYVSDLTSADEKKKVYPRRDMQKSTKNKKKTFFNKNKVKSVE